MPKSRMKARLRPQRKQRRTTREANFGGRFDLAIVDFFAILSEKMRPCGLPKIYAKFTKESTWPRLPYTYAFLNGSPRCLKYASAIFLSFAVVTMVTAIPNTSLSSSSDVSAKTECSFIPRV